MDTYSSTDAKREFGEVLLKSQRSPVSVTRNGKPVAVVMSNDDYQKLKLQALRAALSEGEESGNAGELDIEDIKQKARLKAGQSVNVKNT